MTELLYLEDSYLRGFEATVLAVDGQSVALDRTAFYPGGGGQPADRGVLGARKVVDVRKHDGVVWHELDGAPPDVGSSANGAIDWPRRHLLMRTHMALHLVNTFAWIEFNARVTGAQMEPGKGRVDLRLEAISTELGQAIEHRVNQWVRDDRQISTVYVPRDQADDAIFRGKAFDEYEDPIRTVEVDGLDRQACSGTHTRTTAEIGEIRVTKTESKGRANKRVRIELINR